MFGHDVPPRYPAQYVKKGDRIYVCIHRNHRTLMEFSIENASDYAALIGEIRYAGRDLAGLTTVVIRNHSRGWSEERPLMFYHKWPQPRRAGRRILAPEKATTGMLAPWETH